MVSLYGSSLIPAFFKLRQRVLGGKFGSSLLPEWRRFAARTIFVVFFLKSKNCYIVGIDFILPYYTNCYFLMVFWSYLFWHRLFVPTSYNKSEVQNL
jgi:hypothetical protein